MPNVGNIGPPRGGRKCWRKWAILIPGLRPKWGLVRNDWISSILPKIWETLGQFIYLQKMTLLVANRGWELAEFWENRAIGRRLGILPKMGHFNSRLEFEMGHRQKCQTPMHFPKFWGNPGHPTCRENGPFW